VALWLPYRSVVVTVSLSRLQYQFMQMNAGFPRGFVIYKLRYGYHQLAWKHLQVASDDLLSIGNDLVTAM
jgi:hypothetical protein